MSSGVVTLSSIFNPQFVANSAAALVFAPTGASAVPGSFDYQISTLHVANIDTIPVTLKMWRVPSGASNDNTHVIVPTITIPIASFLYPWFDVTALWGAVLGPGDAIWAVASVASQLIIQGDGSTITI